MAKGDLVLIRTSRGHPGIRRIWDDTVAPPFVCHEEYWQRWERQEITPICWQVDTAHLFQPDPELLDELESAVAAARAGDEVAAARLSELWRRAKPYHG